MLSDPELAALVQQAARNLETLQLLVRTAGEGDTDVVNELRQRLHDLQLACIRETTRSLRGTTGSRTADIVRTTNGTAGDLIRPACPPGR